MHCFGCGRDIKDKSSDRYNMEGPACACAVPVWKRKVEEIVKKKEIDICVDSLMERNGRMCCGCVSAFERLDKLQKSVELNIVEALEVIVDEIEENPRKRRRLAMTTSESSQVASGSGVHLLKQPVSSLKEEKKSPDVAVRLNSFNC